MAVKLEFLTQDQQVIELAKRYWAMDAEGVYLERVADLLPFKNVAKANALSKYIHERCQAYDENQTCPLCDGLILIKARTEAKKTPRRSNQPCQTCQEYLREEDLAREAAERAELEMHLAPHIKSLTAKTVCYRGFGDDTVIILQAISALIGPRLMQGAFSLSDCDQLTPMGAGDFIDLLHTRQVLEDDPTAAPNGTYYVKDGKLWMRKSTAWYFLPPDTDKGREPGLVKELLSWEFSDAEALTNLWLDFAVTDVMRYLDHQCRLHNQILEYEDVQKVEVIVRHGLRRYSVAQLWFIMWKVTRDAAALSRRSYYSQEKATGTIPTKIRKQLELADQGAVLRNDWSRPGPHIAGAIGMIFNSHFGLDELSPGADVLRMFSAIGGKRSCDGELQKLASLFIENTLAGENSLVALDAFAGLIREGLSTEQAILEIIQNRAELFRANPFVSI